MATNKSSSKDNVGPDELYTPLLSLNLGIDFSSSLPQHAIDAIYATEYGTLNPLRTHRPRPLRLDMKKIQQEFRAIMPTGTDFYTAAPHLISRFHAAMQERVAALGRGEPIAVEGHAPRRPGQMMTQWTAEILAGAPSLYHRIEATLAARFLSGDHAK
ncbi:hypothetical protein yc1106_03416 [Curvularia clavata]|uniref:Uncharacterized protein n=1 Tax=Curvularia clavata TaxID=95742 RepID=A0A9Q8Z5P9_CURCL|nr:hypothetical protein yc1106_03416 [Curvularia clavata]